MKSARLLRTARAYLISTAFWYGIALLMGLQYEPLNRQNFWSSFIHMLINAGVHAFVFVLWTPPIFYLVEKYLNFSRNRFRYVLLWCLGSVPFVLLYSGIILVTTTPYDDLLHGSAWRSIHSWLQLVRAGFADESFFYLAIVVAAHAYEYFKRVRRQEAERYQYRQALAASELQALKMQLHPHFLFNTLHGIATLIDGDAKNAKAMIIKLSNLLRTALDRDSSDLISLEDELKFVREYLDLEKMRFGNRLKLEWRVMPETCRLLVPQMILQPLVENAIRHGVASSREGGWIEVATKISDGILIIYVRNSAGGKTANGTGVGLRNVETRLKYLYSGDASLHLTVAEDRTATVSLSLPALNSDSAGVHGRHIQTVPEGEDPSCAFSSSMTNP
jgi:two-component system LytT family sensor kinase